MAEFQEVFCQQILREINFTNFLQSCDEGAIASHSCSDCEDNLCEDCVKAHKRMKITKDHKLTPIANNSSARSISAAAGTPNDVRFVYIFSVKVNFSFFHTV